MIASKKILRERTERIIRSLPEEYILSSNLGISRNIIALPEFISAPRVFTYFSSGREADTKAIIAAAVSLGKTVALPVTLGRGKMYFSPYNGNEDDLTDSFFGIPQPAAGSAELSPRVGDMIVVPALCFDRRGFRLGHGGGYYDRFLAGNPAFTVGLCRELLIYSDVLPAEPHDIRVDCLVTEKSVQYTDHK